MLHYSFKHALPLLLSLVFIRVQAQQFFFSAERPDACASADGILTVVPTQGVPPFTYQWSTGATSVSIRNSVKGAYTVTLTDATGATVAHTYLLNSVEFDLYLADQKPATFCTPNSGLLTVNPVGGVAPFTYTWSNGQNTATASGLAVGTYSVTVVDATGCQAAGQYDIKLPAFLYSPHSEIRTVTQPDCINTANGTLSAVMQNSGYTPFSYSWSNGVTSQDNTGLSNGTYTVTVTDVLGCSATATMTLRKALTMTGSVICSGATTGTASALLVNATAPVSYTWSNGQTGPNLVNVANGTYAVTASDANGCNSSAFVRVAVPVLKTADYSSKCYAGNNGAASVWVENDYATSYLWDNGFTDSWNTTLSPGLHTVTVTTSLGCTLSGTASIAPPAAPPLQINYAVNPANCATGTGGAMNISVTGGFAGYDFKVYGPDGFYSDNIASLQNLQGGSYLLTASSSQGNQYCYASNSVTVPDQGGFSPELVVQDLDCLTGYAAAAVANVTAPAQYEWSMGATSPDVYNLTPGCYSVTVTGGGSCTEYFEFCIYAGDSIQFNTNCLATASGILINDQGIPGCTGTAGIPFQLIRTQPSGALNFTDENGAFSVNMPTGTFDLEPANYDPADIGCPPTGKYTLNTVNGISIPGLDFHFYNTNPVDHRVKQKVLRTAQPGYPYSLRLEVCNDGNTANPGALEVNYGNLLGSMNAVSFSRHAGLFSLVTETNGTPDNKTDFSFPGVAPGACELLQADFTMPTTATLNTEFITHATVTPPSGDPTPDNNTTTLFNTVVGSFDPNSVLAYPARNGNPHDGGDIWRNIDRTITYQIVFQNTGNAPADQVIIRDTLDQQLDINSIRNITASHDVKLSLEGNNDVLVFKFPNIQLPDSSSDYAGSIGSVQYEIALQPGLPVGAKVAKQAAIYFDFNSPVITNRNLLEVVAPSSTQTPGDRKNAIALFPNPADTYFGFYCESGGEMHVFNTIGALVRTQTILPGLQRMSTADLPDGVYLVRLDAGGVVKNGKVAVQH